MVDPNPIVIVIDDDAAFRRSTERLILSVGYKVQTFAAAGEFLRNPRPEAPACVLLDVRLPGLSGLDLQRELVTAGVQIPIIFITGHGDGSGANLKGSASGGNGLDDRTGLRTGTLQGSAFRPSDNCPVRAVLPDIQAQLP